jgi:hypothetical protein
MPCPDPHEQGCPIQALLGWESTNPTRVLSSTAPHSPHRVILRSRTFGGLMNKVSCSWGKRAGSPQTGLRRWGGCPILRPGKAITFHTPLSAEPTSPVRQLFPDAPHRTSWQSAIARNPANTEPILISHRLDRLCLDRRRPELRVQSGCSGRAHTGSLSAGRRAWFARTAFCRWTSARFR